MIGTNLKNLKNFEISKPILKDLENIILQIVTFSKKMETIKQAQLNIEAIKKNIEELAKVFNNDMVEKIVIEQLKKLKNDGECLVCTETTTNKISCCEQFLCLECYDKVGKCPYCRFIYNKEKDNDVSDQINDEYLVSFPFHEEVQELEAVPVQNEPVQNEPIGYQPFTNNDEIVLIHLMNEIKKLEESGNIICKRRNEYLTFIHPATNRRFTGSESSIRLIDYILKNSPSNVLSKFGDSFHFSAPMSTRGLYKFETKSCLHIWLSREPRTRRSIFYKNLCEQLDISNLFMKKLTYVIFNNEIRI